ncbi:hypothetical protein D3C73_1274990 [compost metagenome]
MPDGRPLGNHPYSTDFYVKQLGRNGIGNGRGVMYIESIHADLPLMKISVKTRDLVNELTVAG